MASHVGSCVGLLLAAVFGTAACARRDVVPQSPGPSPAPVTDSIDFDRDVRPILAENCFACHGNDPSSRAADLRLDTLEGITADLGGYRAVVPGDPDQSELMVRVRAPDPDDRMPPVESHKTLSPEQIETLERWISQGATWRGHWAFEPIERRTPPHARDDRWSRNPIDRFVRARLAKAGLEPSPPADPRTLIRRLYLDLTGLPPTVEAARAFEADGRPDAYERLVDALLDSPRYGEHMARSWLDAARYGDTHGLHMDNARQVWPYRDWVVRAFNHDLPYSDFLTDQLAGDLRPGATVDQRIASGFNRMHVTTHEGGVVIDEVRVRNVVDRTSTAATVFMGLSAGCAVCHDHKFDPLTQREFYSLYAFFNNFDGDAIDANRADHAPVVRVPWGDQIQAEAEAVAQVEAARASYEATRVSARTQKRLARWLETAHAAHVPEYGFPGAHAHFPLDRRGAKSLDDERKHWPVANTLDPKRQGKTHGNPRFTRAPHGHGIDLRKEGIVTASVGDFGRDDPFTLAVWARVAPDAKGGLLSRFDHEQQRRRGYDLSVSEGRLTFRLMHDRGEAIRVETQDAVLGCDRWVHVGLRYDGGARADGVQIFIDGDPVRVRIEEDTLLGSARSLWEFRIGYSIDTGHMRSGRLDDLWIFARALDAREIALLADRDPIAPILTTSASARAADDMAFLREFYLDNVDPQLLEGREKLRQAELELSRLRHAFDSTLVMVEQPRPRPSHVLERGAYDHPGDPVEPATPAFLPPMDPNLPPNRLGLAKWLLAPEHPLTARVAVNRIWQQIFGEGLVATSEDFGAQGQRPSHPELLDWLATEFRDSGWRVKDLVRTIVTSSVYRQSSRVEPAPFEVDPSNRLLARSPRYRLDGEVLRDQALWLADRLVLDLGGPGVKPPQPPGLWKAVSLPSSNTSAFEADTGDAIYRRSLYTYWKRTAPNPVLATFGTPSRESCAVRRERTNTPLQALVTLNEAQFMEAARHLARQSFEGGDLSPEARLGWLWERVTLRTPTGDELAIMGQLLETAAAHYLAAPDQARELLGQWESEDPPTAAAWVLVANAMLNLDEVLNRE